MKQEPLKQKKNSGLTGVLKSPLIGHYRKAGNRAIQAKMTMGKPGDEYEQEADRVAAQVVRMSEPTSLEEEEDQVAPKLQREELEEEEEPEQEGEPSISAKADPGGTSEISPDVEANIDALKGGGQPLSESIRDFFEPRFGADFGHVRIHTGPRAAQTAQAINAKAFTTGKDIAFNAGQYSPETIQGKHLLAHELTHVVQQKNDRYLPDKAQKKSPEQLIHRKNELTYDPDNVEHVYVKRRKNNYPEFYWVTNDGKKENMGAHPRWNPPGLGDYTISGIESKKNSGLFNHPTPHITTIKYDVQKIWTRKVTITEHDIVTSNDHTLLVAMEYRWRKYNTITKKYGDWQTGMIFKFMTVNAPAPSTAEIIQIAGSIASMIGIPLALVLFFLM